MPSFPTGLPVMGDGWGVEIAALPMSDPASPSAARGSAGVEHERAARSAKEESHSQPEHLDAGSLVQLVWAVSHLRAGLFLGWRFPGVAIQACLPQLDQQQLAVLLWSLALQQFVDGRLDAPRDTQHPTHTLSHTNTGPAGSVSSSGGGGGGSSSNRGSSRSSGSYLHTLQTVLVRLFDGGLSGVADETSLTAAEALSMLLISPSPRVRQLTKRGVAQAMSSSTKGILRRRWQRSCDPAHPDKEGIEAVLLQLGYSPRRLQTDPNFPLSTASLVTAVRMQAADGSGGGDEMSQDPVGAAGPGVERVALVLAEDDAFAGNVEGEPLGPLFITATLMQVWVALV